VEVEVEVEVRVEVRVGGSVCASVGWSLGGVFYSKVIRHSFSDIVFILKHFKRTIQ
jgi:hypothetical protein